MNVEVSTKLGIQLYYFNWHIPTYISGVMASDIEEKLDLGEYVFLVSCRGVLKPCWNNMEGKESICRVCRFNQRSNKIFNDSRIKKLFIDDHLSSREREQAFITSRLMDYHDIESIKDLKYEGMDLGYGALSSYISFTRNNNPVLDDTFREFFDQLLKVELAVVLALKKIFSEHIIKEFVVFNGRLHDVRPALLMGQGQSFPIRVLEAVVKNENERLSVSFPGVLPQDIAYQDALMNQIWRGCGYSDEEKVVKARKFYEDRRAHRLVQDFRVYTKDQKDGLLPEAWKNNQRNLVLFTSSEDEFTALGRDWDLLALFDSQINGVRFVAETLKNEINTHLYIRLHPNLTGNTFDYHLDYYHLEKEFENITIIPPDSPISTYSLIDHMDLGICFGSSVGIEASASNKPMILLAGCYYYYLEATYNPKNKAELEILLKQKHLESKNKLGSDIYGFYMSNPELYAKPFKYSLRIKRFLGITYWVTPHMEFLGSQLFYKFCFTILKRKHNLVQKILNMIKIR